MWYFFVKIEFNDRHRHNGYNDNNNNNNTYMSHVILIKWNVEMQIILPRYVVRFMHICIFSAVWIKFIIIYEIIFIYYN